MHGHITSAKAKLSRQPVFFYLYGFSLCVIVFVLAVAGGPENVWAAAKKYFGPRDLLQTTLTSFLLSKKGWSCFPYSSTLHCSIFLKYHTCCSFFVIITIFICRRAQLGTAVNLRGRGEEMEKYKRFNFFSCKNILLESIWHKKYESTLQRRSGMPRYIISTLFLNKFLKAFFVKKSENLHVVVLSKFCSMSQCPEFPRYMTQFKIGSHVKVAPN